MMPTGNAQQSLFRFGRRLVHRLPAACKKLLRGTEAGLPPFPATRALAWLRRTPAAAGGARLPPGQAEASAGVRGELVPTLLRYGEADWAANLVRWLVCSQRANGAFVDSTSGSASLVDTCQVVRGLCAGRDLLPQALEAARRAADHVASQLAARAWTPDVLLPSMPPLLEASRALNEPRYAQVVQAQLERFLAQQDVPRAGDPIHRLAPQLEAVIDLGRPDLALPALDTLARQQAPDGSVPAQEGAAWVCLPGLAQLAVCWYKAGRAAAADQALACLNTRQRTSGGLLGSYGKGATYSPDGEVAWAVRLFLDAHALRSVSLFERESRDLPAQLTPDDPRVQVVLSSVQPGDRVLQVGCGAGGFLQAVRAAHPGCECSGLPGSPALLPRLPQGVRPVAGYLESVQASENAFDGAFITDDALERSANPERALYELIRVTKRGGWIVVFNKRRGDWKRVGQVGPPQAELDLRKLLNRKCDRVSVKRLGGGVQPNGRTGSGQDVWRAQKRSPLSGPEWYDALVSPADELQTVEAIRQNRMREWDQPVLLRTAPGQKVLEVGSGTGLNSVRLALAGRVATATDIDSSCLEFTRRCAERLGVSVRTVEANALEPLPFADDEFHCTWNAGLMDRMTTEQRQFMLRDWARVSSGQVITLTTNAASVAYRVGRALQEEQGTWPYGWEIALRSLREDFEAVGLHVHEEFTVAAQHSLQFLPPNHPLRRHLSEWMESLSASELADIGQGWLVVTVGSKHPKTPER